MATNWGGHVLPLGGDGPVDEEDEKRLRKKFRGKLPADVIRPIDEDTRSEGPKHRVRNLVLSLTEPGFKARASAELAFREIANDVARMVDDNAVLQSWFLGELLWSL
jgi:hypothetical protein